MSKRNLNKDDFKYIRDEMVSRQDCYVVEALAKDKSEKFNKRIFWIRKDNYVLVKSEFYTPEGQWFKTFTAGSIKKINNIWTVLTAKMENSKKEYTILKLSKVKYNVNLSDRLFIKEGLKK
jgi:hypothetical protein